MPSPSPNCPPFTEIMMRLRLVFCLAFISSLGLLSPPTNAAESPQINFAREIQPIFARHCFKCHGPTESEGGLRLDSRDAALAELDSGALAIVPGNVAESEIVHRLTTDDEDLRMPPEGKPLSADEVELVRNWIQQEAPWSEHWSFRRVERPQVPTPKQREWVRNPIDAFVLSRLEAAGLQPAPQAEKIALIRRAYYDLTGLPPSPREVDEFLADDSHDAFEKIVDRLLDSAQYGEKWARHWLDLVRYAETNGYERDGRKELIWKYRDYVIRAFNEDKPFDRFIREQLAGDELPDKTADSIIATGFYRLGLWDDEPVDRLKARYDYLDDILRTTSESFLAMTIGCARCHDHKIDPVSQKDYYSMLAFFSDISPHGKGNANHVAIASPTGTAEFERRLAAKQAQEHQLQTDIDAIESQIVAKIQARHADIRVRNPDDAGTPVLADSIEGGQTWEYTFKRPAPNWFEIAFDDSQWHRGPGGFGAKGTPGSVVRTDWHGSDIWLRKDFPLDSIPTHVTLQIHHDEDAEVYLNGKQIARFTGATVAYKRVDVTTEASDVLQTGRNTLAIHCRQSAGGQYIDAGLWVVEDTWSIAELLEKYGDEVSLEQHQQLQRLRRKLARSRSRKLELTREYAMAVSESGSHRTWILARGNPNSTGEEVSPAFPHILDPRQPVIRPPSDTNTSGKRSALADWIASPDNPATGRVIVNRIWQHHFGRGIVRSSSDFGYQGIPPTHPQLLDWLAAELVANGWRMKALHKLMMLSATYQMSSAGNPEALAQDPVNDLLWRFNMRRITAEEIRDSILLVGGTLNCRMFGPSIFPPLSKEVLATASRPSAAWGHSTPEESARRSIYVHVKRSLRPPMLANFDAPDTDTSCAARVTTTVPTQALGMLNSRFLNEQAGIFADRLSRELPDDVGCQVERAIRLTTGRPPEPAEIQADVQFINELKEHEQLSSAEALRMYCLMMLNANEFVYLD